MERSTVYDFPIDRPSVDSEPKRYLRGFQRLVIDVKHIGLLPTHRIIHTNSIDVRHTLTKTVKKR